MPALAQSNQNLDSSNLVLARPRPGYDAEGMPIGGFRAYPSVDLSAAYDDNIYATQNDKVRSAILTVAPDLRLVSQWARHSLILDASGTFERYPQRTTENNNRYTLDANGRLDLADFAALGLEAHNLQSIEARGTAGDIFTAGQPIRFERSGGTAIANVTLASINATFTGVFDRTTYRNAIVGGVSFSQAYRNRDYFSGDVQIAYDLGGAFKPFVEAKHENERYDQRARDTSLDSSGWIALGGVKIGFTQLLTGRVAVGYRWRNFRNPGYVPTRGLSYDLALVWNPRTLLTVTVGAVKSIEESPDPASSGIVSTVLSLSANYELLRNVLINASVDHANERYRGIDRTDRRLTANIEARYLLNRFMHIGARYTYTTQNGSGILGRSYRDNVIGLVLTLQR